MPVACWASPSRPICIKVSQVGPNLRSFPTSSHQPSHAQVAGRPRDPQGSSVAARPPLRFPSLSTSRANHIASRSDHRRRDLNGRGWPLGRGRSRELRHLRHVLGECRRGAQNGLSVRQVVHPRGQGRDVRCRGSRSQGARDVMLLRQVEDGPHRGRVVAMAGKGQGLAISSSRARTQ